MPFESSDPKLREFEKACAQAHFDISRELHSYTMCTQGWADTATAINTILENLQKLEDKLFEGEEF